MLGTRKRHHSAVMGALGVANCRRTVRTAIVTIPKVPYCKYSRAVHPETNQSHLTGGLGYFLSDIRAIFAILISLSLVFAPVTSAWAVGQMSQAMAMGAEMNTAAPSEHGDCHKAMKPPAPKNCACCDTHAKSPFPSADTCIAKCSMHILAILAPTSEGYLVVVRYSGPTEPEKPPDWRLSPPAPPPRA
jgi:hypothetical protein